LPLGRGGNLGERGLGLEEAGNASSSKGTIRVSVEVQMSSCIDQLMRYAEYSYGGQRIKGKKGEARII